ncbi:MAG: SprT protein [Bacteroidia bacterium]
MLHVQKMPDSKPAYIERLVKYIPTEAAEGVYDYLKTHRVHLKIKKPRLTKLGDYRQPFKDKGHRISVNNDLNKFAFLITLVHEMAHLETFTQHQNRKQPHGAEWKTNFKLLIAPFIELGIFPTNVLNALTKYMKNPAASSCVDVGLSEVLRSYNALQHQTVSDIALGQEFTLKNGKRFKKGEQLRKRFKCLCLDDKRMYFVSPLAEVKKE